MEAAGKQAPEDSQGGAQGAADDRGEAFRSVEAQEGWNETASTVTNADFNSITRAAEAAKLSETGADGYVSIEGMGGVIQTVQKVFQELDKGATGKVNPVELVQKLKGVKSVKRLLKEPARMREADGKHEPLSSVLSEIEHTKSDTIELKDVFASLGLGGPTNKGASMEESEEMKKVRAQFAEEEVGRNRIVYFGGARISSPSLLKEHAKKRDAPTESRKQRLAVEAKSGPGMVTNNRMSVFDANNLKGSQPTTRGSCPGSLGHTVCSQPLRVYFHRQLSPSGFDGKAVGAHQMDLSHLARMVPQDVGKKKTNLAAAQLEAALNTCIGLLESSTPASQPALQALTGAGLGAIKQSHCPRDYVDAALSQFVTAQDRAKILDRASVAPQAGGKAKGDKEGEASRRLVDLNVVKQEARKCFSFGAFTGTCKKPGKAACRPSDFREIKVSIVEIALSDQVQSHAKVWFETHLLERETDFRSVTSSCKVGSGAHKLDGLDVVYSLQEASGSVLRACRDIIDCKVQGFLVVEVWASDDDGEAAGAKIGEARLNLNRGKDQVLDIVAPGGKENLGKLKVQLDFNSEYIENLLSRSFIDTFNLYAFGGLQVGPRDSFLPSNALQVYLGASNEWEKVNCTGQIPAPTSCHASIIVGDFMIVHGGLDKQNVVQSQMHAFQISKKSWTPIKLSDNSLDGRFDHSAELLHRRHNNDVRRYVVFFGGERESGTLANSVSVLEMLDMENANSGHNFASKLSNASMSGAIPAPRAGHATTVMRREGQDFFYAFGGRTNPDPDNNLNLSSEVLCGYLSPMSGNHSRMNFHWEAVHVEGPCPPPREKCTMESVGTKLVVSHGWLGFHDQPFTNDMWILDTSHSVWNRVSLTEPEVFQSAGYGIGSALVKQNTEEVPDKLCLYSVDSSGKMHQCAQEEALTLSAGAKKRFCIHSLDSAGMPFSKHGQAFVVMFSEVMSDGSKRIVEYPQVSQMPQNYAMHAFEIMCSALGEHYEVEVYSEGQLESSTVYRATIIPEQPCNACIVVYGDGLKSCIAGEAADFTIALHDQHGNPVGKVSDKDLAQMSCTIRGGKRVFAEVSLKRKQNNAIHASYEMKTAGTYKVHILFEGKEVINGPFTLVCKPNTFSIPHTCVQESTLKQKCSSGQEFRFNIVACDAMGNPVDIQNVPGYHSIYKAWFEQHADVHKHGEKIVGDCEFFENGDGTLGVKVEPAKCGQCIINVNYTIKGKKKPENIIGSPFMLQIMSNELDPGKSEIIRGLTPKAIAGEEQVIVVEARDKFGNGLGVGGDKLRCRFENSDIGKPSINKVNIVDQRDGTYELKYFLRDANSYFMHIDIWKSLMGHFQPIRGSPFKLKVVQGAVNARDSTAYGSGINGTSCAGLPAEFTVESRDKFGNRVNASGASVEVIVQAGWTIPASVTDNGDGTYKCTYTPGKEPEFQGKTVYSVDVNLNGLPIRGSPFIQRVYPPQTSAYQSVAVGVPSCINSGETTEFVIQARDPKGQDIAHGMDSFVLDIQMIDKSRKPQLRGEVKDLHSGKYLVRLFVDENVFSNVSLGILLGGDGEHAREHIRDSPFNLIVSPAGLFNMGLWGASKLGITSSEEEILSGSFVLSGGGLLSGSAGEEAQFDLTLVEANMLMSRRLESMALNKDIFSVELSGPQYIAGRVEGPTSDGHFHASYRAFVAGTYSLLVKIGKFTLPQCPFEVKIAPDITEPDNCTIDSQGLVGRNADQKLSIQIATYDTHSNRSFDDNDTFRIDYRGGSLQGKGKNTKFQKVIREFYSVPFGDGLHEAWFQVPIEGAYSLRVMHARKPSTDFREIGESPVQFEVSVSPTAERARASRVASQKEAAALSMKALTLKAIETSGAGERRPNFLERRVKRFQGGEGTKDIGNEDDAMEKSIFNLGLWQKQDYWKEYGIHSQMPSRKTQFEQYTRISKQ